MKKITAAQFRQSIELDPAWALKLTEPIEILDYCDMADSHITHLSPFLRFTGRNKKGHVASFCKCSALGVAEGTFLGYVTFDYSGVERIGKLVITKSATTGVAASFDSCEMLRVAEGTFAGSVSFCCSAVEKIGVLQIMKPDRCGTSASFCGCHMLTVAEGVFPGSVFFTRSGIMRIDTDKLVIKRPDKKGRAACFAQCPWLKIATGTYPGSVDFSDSEVERIDSENLVILRPDNKGMACNFQSCLLDVAEGEFPGFVNFADTRFCKVGELKITPPSLCDKYIHISGSQLEKNVAELVRKVFSNESRARLKSIQNSLPKEESILAEAISDCINCTLRALEAIRCEPLEI